MYQTMSKAVYTHYLFNCQNHLFKSVLLFQLLVWGIGVGQGAGMANVFCEGPDSNFGLCGPYGVC